MFPLNIIIRFEEGNIDFRSEFGGLALNWNVVFSGFDTQPTSVGSSVSPLGGLQIDLRNLVIGPPALGPERVEYRPRLAINPFNYDLVWSGGREYPDFQKDSKIGA